MPMITDTRFGAIAAGLPDLDQTLIDQVLEQYVPVDAKGYEPGCVADWCEELQGAVADARYFLAAAFLASQMGALDTDEGDYVDSALYDEYCRFAWVSLVLVQSAWDKLAQLLSSWGRLDLPVNRVTCAAVRDRLRSKQGLGGVRDLWLLAMDSRDYSEAAEARNGGVHRRHPYRDSRSFADWSIYFGPTLMGPQELAERALASLDALVRGWQALAPHFLA